MQSIKRDNFRLPSVKESSRLLVINIESNKFSLVISRQIKIEF